MRAVNLLPEDAQPRKLSAPPLAPTLGVAAVVVAAGVVGAAAHVESGKVADRQAQVDALEAQLAHVPSSTAASSDRAVVSLLSTRDQRIAALNSALSARVPVDRVMQQLSLVLPDDVWLDGLTLAPNAAGATAPTPGTPAAPNVTISGYTYKAESVARLMQRLAVVPSLTGVTLGNAQIQPVGTKNVFHFTVNATLVKGGAS